MIHKNNILYKILGTIFLSIGTLFLILSLVVFLFLPSNTDWAPTDITGDYTLSIGVFLGIGAIFTLIGIVFFLFYKHKEAKIIRLKNEGICYDAEITDVKPLPYMRYGKYGYYSNPVFIVECWYRNHEGKTCIVKSDEYLTTLMFFGEKKDNLKAKVYVNRNNPKDYYVEITTSTQADLKFDNDYR